MANAPFPSVPTILETFTRANGTWGSGWTTLAGTSAIVSNTAKASAAPMYATWNATQFGANQEARCDLVTKNATALTGFGVMLRWDPVAVNGYIAFFDTGNGVVSFYKVVAGATSQIGSSATCILSAGNTAGAVIVGQLLTVWAMASGVWVPVTSWTDATYTAAGYAGLQINDTTTVVDNFTAGNFQAATPGQLVGASMAAQRASRY